MNNSKDTLFRLLTSVGLEISQDCRLGELTVDFVAQERNSIFNNLVILDFVPEIYDLTPTRIRAFAGKVDAFKCNSGYIVLGSGLDFLNVFGLEGCRYDLDLYSRRFHIDKHVRQLFATTGIKLIGQYWPRICLRDMGDMAVTVEYWRRWHCDAEWSLVESLLHDMRAPDALDPIRTVSRIVGWLKEMDHEPFSVPQLFESILSQLPKAARSRILLEYEQGLPKLFGDMRVLRLTIVEFLIDGLRLNREESLAIHVGLTVNGSHIWIRFQGWHWGMYRFGLSLLRMTMHSFHGRFDPAFDRNSFRGIESDPGHILLWLPTHDTLGGDDGSSRSQ